MPFLCFYYDTFPAVDKGLAGEVMMMMPFNCSYRNKRRPEVASLTHAGGNGFNDSASNGCASDKW